MWDYGELDNRLSDANVTRSCLACGSDDVSYADRRIALIDVTDEGRVDIRPSIPAAAGIFCGPRICNACGFVHLYSLVAVGR